MNFTFDYYHNLDRVDVYLCNPDGKQLYSLPCENREVTLRFNDLSEFTFEISDLPTQDGGSNEYYEYIETKRLVNLDKIGYFRISKVEETLNGVVPKKSVTAESLQSVFNDFGVSTEDRIYAMYNPGDPRDSKYDMTDVNAIPSVIGQLCRQCDIDIDLSIGINPPASPCEKWTIGYINAEVGAQYRSFSDEDVTAYDFLVNKVESAFEAIVCFDFLNKVIRIVSDDDVSADPVTLLTFGSYMSELKVDEDASDIITVMNCTGEGLDAALVNPTGTPYIVDFSYYMDTNNGRWMSSELIEKLNQWSTAVSSAKDNYTNLVKQLRNLNYERTVNSSTLSGYSIVLKDINNASDQRKLGLADGSYTAKGVVTVETLTAPGKSIDTHSKYSTSTFTPSTVVTAHSSPPTYNYTTHKWSFSDTGTSASADSNFAANKTYFIDCKDGSNESYCQLTGSAKRVEVFTGNGSTKRYTLSTGVEAIAGVTVGGKKTLSYSYDATTRVIEFLNTPAADSEISVTEVLSSGMCNGFVRRVEYEKADAWATIYTQKVNTINATIATQDASISALQSNLQTISSSLNIINYFSNTPNLLSELRAYWVEGTYNNENLAVLDSTTIEEAMDMAEELLNSASKELNKQSKPKHSLNVSATEALRLYENRTDFNNIELGSVIAVEKEDGVWYYPTLLEMKISLDTADKIEMTFANSDKLDSASFAFADIVANSSSVSKQVSSNWTGITSYGKHKEEISDLIKDPLNSTLHAAYANMNNQNFVIDDTGILGRKMSNSGTPSNEQVRMINNLLLFTDDGWNSIKTALGKVSINGSTSYGLIAETLVGSLILGDKLKIGNSDGSVDIDENGIVIKHNGDTVFSADNSGDVYMSGEINASSGVIGDSVGGFTIKPYYLSGEYKDSTYDADNNIEIFATGAISMGPKNYDVLSGDSQWASTLIDNNYSHSIIMAGSGPLVEDYAGTEPVRYATRTVITDSEITFGTRYGPDQTWANGRPGNQDHNFVSYYPEPYGEGDGKIVLGEDIYLSEHSNETLYEWINSISSGSLSSYTWRPIKTNGTERYSNDPSGSALDLCDGNGISLNWDSTNKKIKINHSNSINAATSQALKIIAYDAQGHITGAKNAAAIDLPAHEHDYADRIQYDDTTSKIEIYHGEDSETALSSATIPNATTAKSGLMSSSDKTQLNKVTDEKISAWDAKYSKPSGGIPSTDVAFNYAGSSSKGGAANSVKTALTFNNGGSGAASGTTFDGSTARTISYNTIGAASASHNHDGTYPKISDFSDLNSVKGITEDDIIVWNAKSEFSGSYNDLTNKPTIPVVDASLDSTSTNAIQNKAVKTALDGKSNTNHTHSYLPLTGGTIQPSTASSAFPLIVNNNATLAVGSYPAIGGINVFAPNLATGQKIVLGIGKASSNYNRGSIYYKHAGGNGYTSNYVAIGLYGKDDILSVVGTGKVGINNTSPSADLDVNGVTNSTSYKVANSAVIQYNSSAGVMEIIC